MPRTMASSLEGMSTRQPFFESHFSEVLPLPGTIFSIRWGRGSVAFRDPRMLWSAKVAKSEEESARTGWRSLLLQARQNTLSSLLYLLQELHATSLAELKSELPRSGPPVGAYHFSLRRPAAVL